MDVYDFITRQRKQEAVGPAFVLGSGSSLRHLESGRLPGMGVIACNSSILKVPQANFYFATDGGVSYFKSFDSLLSLYCWVVIGSNCNHFAYNLDRVPLDPARLVRLPVVRDGYDFTQKKLIRGLSCVHVAAHFAYLLGYSPIVLLGCDCTEENGKVWFWEFDGEEREEVHEHHPGFIGAEGEKRYFGAFETGWKWIKEQTPVKLPILNASGGTLEVWPRITLKEVYKL